MKPRAVVRTTWGTHEGSAEMEDTNYSSLLISYLRGKLGCEGDLSLDEALHIGRDRGLDIHTFKRTIPLPRVKEVLGMLKGLAPSSLLDIGSGRGAFLWPLLNEFPQLPVLAIDRSTWRVGEITAVSRGGISNLRSCVMDVHSLGVPSSSFDVVTILEVLEHLEKPEEAVRETVRASRRFVIASVPSAPDNNPGHIRLFKKSSISRLFLDAGANNVKVRHVLGHMIIFATIGKS